MMIEKPVKTKSNRKRLIKLLDEAVSQLVIARDKKCVQCGSKEKLTCGHLFSRGTYSTRWDLLNCNCQCWACNFGHTYDTSKYTKWFLDKYGQEVWDALYLRFHTPRKWTDVDMEAMLSGIRDDLKRYTH